MRVYRIAYRKYSADPLNGEGSFLFGARWSSPRTRVAYTSSAVSLAMIEFLAHLDLEDIDPNSPPALVAVSAEVPDAAIATLAALGAALPNDWKATPAPLELAAIGDRWIAGGSTLALAVPSCHLPQPTPEVNVLINPAHPDFRGLRPALTAFRYDERLLGRRR